MRQLCPLTFNVEGGMQSCSPGCAWIIGDECSIKLLAIRADTLINAFIDETGYQEL
jgi:hypothetical protein